MFGSHLRRQHSTLSKNQRPCIHQCLFQSHSVFYQLKETPVKRITKNMVSSFRSGSTTHDTTSTNPVAIDTHVKSKGKLQNLSTLGRIDKVGKQSTAVVDQRQFAHTGTALGPTVADPAGPFFAITGTVGGNVPGGAFARQEAIIKAGKTGTKLVMPMVDDSSALQNNHVVVKGTD
jgi:hypothetical protein